MRQEVRSSLNENFNSIVKRVYLDPLFISQSLSFVKVETKNIRLECGDFSGASTQRFPIQFESQNLGFVEALDFESKTTKKALQNLSQTLGALENGEELGLSAKSKILTSFEAWVKERPDFNWIGIYRRDPIKPQELIVSAFIGEPTPHIRIPLDRGICGAAIYEGRSLNIPNVKSDARYLSCSLKTKSELVVPIFNQLNEAVAEIDIDCASANGFDALTQQEFESLAKEFSVFF
ncbi:MAG: hypothetical protein COV44_04920 [Deltaproteobacteria bacterium CG11_big_fil_rev_8_21_14_0_20_45_16]|nr:MAG: hypothetical protein COV44_04920 [Deltaproteobacteria bacterium CG11_big_fil_rev_8_21_14_0_20_45_16]